MSERIEIPCGEADRLLMSYGITRAADATADHGAWPDDECGSAYYWQDRLHSGAKLCGERDADGCRHWIEAL